MFLCLSAFNPSSQVHFECCRPFPLITKRASFRDIKWSPKLTLILQIHGDRVEGNRIFISRHADLRVVVQNPWRSCCFQMLYPRYSLKILTQECIPLLGCPTDWFPVLPGPALCFVNTYPKHTTISLSPLYPLPPSTYFLGSLWSHPGLLQSTFREAH